MIRNVLPLLGRSFVHLAEPAVDLAIEVGRLIAVPGGLQARAPWYMEREIERSLRERDNRPRHPVDPVRIEMAILDVEREDGISLEPEQRQAVHMALTRGVSLITGGAGTGKSTVVKAILRAARRVGIDAFQQIALSGRAAKRLREATGQEASTIYRYLKALENQRLRFPDGILVIDEFSMVSTPDLWLIVDATPPGVDIVLVGDDGQLPPIQAGNPIAAAIASTHLPRISLTVPHRQKASMSIAEVGALIRQGVLPSLPPFDPNKPDLRGAFIVPCSQDHVAGRVLDVFGQLVDANGTASTRRRICRLYDSDVQILTMTKNGLAGSIALGDAVEARWLAEHTPVDDWGFHIGSKLLWTKNAYDRPAGLDLADQTVDIMNGALGVITGITDGGAAVRFDDDSRAEIRRADLGDMLRGWAITTHKAQGSAFRFVVVPVVKSRLLDRAMLYTAVTRARETVVLVGDPDLIRQAVAAPPTVDRRQQGLDFDRQQPASEPDEDVERDDGGRER